MQPPHLLLIHLQTQAVYEALSEEEQACARWIFLNLTQLGEGTEDTRRRLSKAELVVRKYPEGLVDRTLKALTTAKLVVVASAYGETARTTALSHREEPAVARGIDDFDKARTSSLGRVLLDEPDGLPVPEVTVEVAHEILIRHWSTLRWWLEENRTRLRSQRQVEQAALAWKQNDEQADFLLRGLPLDAAVELYVQYTDELSQDVQTFVETGLAAREAEQEKTQKELKRAKRAIALISTLAVGVAGFGGAAYLQRQQARFREVEALNALSTAQLSNHQALESTMTAVKAGELLQDIRGMRFLGSWLGGGTDALVSQTTGTLQQAVSLGAERNRLEGHSEQVRAIAYSPDGERLASVSDDGTLKVWRADGAQVRSVVVDGHPENPRLNSRALDVGYSPDGGLIAVAQSNGAVTVWSAVEEEGEKGRKGERGKGEREKGEKEKGERGKGEGPQQTIAAHADWVTAVAFRPDGGAIATAGRDGLIKLWNVADGKLLQTLTGHKGWVNSISWRPDGQRLVSGGEDQRLRLWDVSDGKVVWERVGHGQRVASVAFSADGQWVASGGGDRTVKLWDVADLSKKASVQIIGDHDDQVNDVAFSADGQALLSVGADRHVKVWRVEDGAPIADFQGHGGEVLTAAWHPEKQQIASSSRDNTVRLWQVPLAEPLSPALASVQFSPDGSLLAGATWDGGIELWQRDGRQLGSQLMTLGEQNKSEGENHIAQIAFSPNQQQLAAAHEEGEIKLWNWVEKTEMSLLTGNAEAITTVAFSPNGKWLLSGGEDRALRLWNPVEGTEEKTWEAHEDGVSAVAWHPKNRLMASGSYDKTVKIWDAKGEVEGNLKRTLEGHGEAIAALTFTPDGKYLTSSAWDNTIKIWRVRDGKLIRTLTGHQNGVTGLTFFPEGDVLISSSADQTLKVWNFHTGELVSTLKGHQQAVEGLSLTADGTLLISSGDNLEMQLWEWTLAEILGEGCRQLGSYLATNPNVLDKDICEQL